jgi:chorismate synthase
VGGRLRFLTAGESHGEALTAVIDGLPAGLALTEADINRDLARRQRGYGRGGRMKIEQDQVHISAGVRWGLTLGSPLTLTIRNRDWENWQQTMSVGPRPPGASAKTVTRPRPGHADLAGAMKYGHRDIRNVLERSSARETTARVAVAGVAKRLLGEFGITILSHVSEIGGVRIGTLEIPWEEVQRRAEASEVRCADPAAEAAMIEVIDRA